MIRVYRFYKEKPKNIMNKYILLLCCTVLCSLGFVVANQYFLDASLAPIFFKGAMFYLIILMIGIICRTIQLIEEMQSAKKNGIRLSIFSKVTNVVKSFKGCSLESLLEEYDGYYDYEGQNVICIYNQLRYKILIDYNHTIQDVLQGYNVSEMNWLEKRVRDLHIQQEKNRVVG